MLDGQGVNQRIREFHEQHGSFILVNEWLLFEDGALRERNPMGRLIPPPTDPQEKAKNIVRYHQEKLDLAVQEFDHFKRNITMNAKMALKQSTVPAPVEQPETVISQLRELQKKVKQCQKQLSKAEAEVESFIPQRQRELQAMSNRNREANEQLLNELDNIEI